MSQFIFIKKSKKIFFFENQDTEKTLTKNETKKMKVLVQNHIYSTRDNEKQLEKKIYLKNRIFNYENLCIPRRPLWHKSLKDKKLKNFEEQTFLNWTRFLTKISRERGLTTTPYEKNLNVWRQLWRVIERSDIVIQIVDARNPLLFISKDLLKH